MDSILKHDRLECLRNEYIRVLHEIDTPGLTSEDTIGLHLELQRIEKMMVREIVGDRCRVK